MPPSVTRLAPLLLLVGLTACGGESESEPPADPSSRTAAAFAVEDGITPADLLGCLEAEGLPVVAKDSTPLGVEVPVEGLEVGPLAGGTSGDSDQGADLWVFTSAAAASENRVGITFEDVDSPSGWVAGNVVVRLFYPAGDGDTQIEALRGCLP